MMNILHLLWDGDQGGVQRYVNKVVTSKEWQRSHHSIVIFTEPGEIINQSLSGVEVNHLNLPNAYSLRKCYKALKELIKKQHIDIVHCHCDTLAFLSLMRFFPEVKMIYTEHGDSFVRNERQVCSHLLWNLNGRRWDKIILNSNYTKDKFAVQFPHLKQQTTIVENPLLEEFLPLSRSLRKRPKIATVGRLAHVKGNDLFLKSCQQIVAEIPDVEIHIFGKGEEKENLCKLAEELGLHDNVAFRGFTANPLKEMAEMDLVIVPSRRESFGLVALEALSVGTPVVAFTATGVSDFLRNCHHGYLVPMENTRAMGKAAVDILSNPDLWLSMSRNGIQMVKENYTLGKHVARLEEIYGTLTDEQNRLSA